MYIVSRHRVSDPAEFRRILTTTAIPGHLTLLHGLEFAHGSRVLMLWEARAVADLEYFLERALGRAATSHCRALPTPPRTLRGGDAHPERVGVTASPSGWRGPTTTPRP